MAKLIYACLRQPSAGVADQLRDSIANISRHLEPAAVEESPAHIHVSSDTVLGVLEPTAPVPVRDRSVCLGRIADSAAWHKPGTGRPHGIYLVARADNDTLEVLTDATASRSAWYYHDENVFLLSSSQRAIVMLLGDLHLSDVASSWMLSIGAVGPLSGWDSRIRRLGSRATLRLNRKSWRFSIDTARLPQQISSDAEDMLRGKLLEVLRDAVETLQLDLDRWILPLSGGLDCRGLLFLLTSEEGAQKPRTITWGNRTSLQQEWNDARVAADLAEEMGVENRFFDLASGSESFETCVDRFVRNSEGCLDNFSGYVDGFRIWSNLRNEGVHGIIRGDEVFGDKPVANEEDVVRNAGVIRWDDYQNLPDSESVGIENIELPADMCRLEGETLEYWRDRLRCQFRMPFVISSLNEVKTSYVDAVSPFVVDTVVDFMLSLPDELRTGKKLYKSLFSGSGAIRLPGPQVPAALYPAIDSLVCLLRMPDAKEFLQDELRSLSARAQFSSELLRWVSASLKCGVPERRNWKLRVKEAVASAGLSDSQTLRALKRIRRVRRNLDPNILAFRMVLTMRIRQLLADDARRLGTRLPLG